MNDRQRGRCVVGRAGPGSRWGRVLADVISSEPVDTAPPARCDSEHDLRPSFSRCTLVRRRWQETEGTEINWEAVRRGIMVAFDESITAVNCHVFLVRRDALLNANWSFIDSGIMPPSSHITFTADTGRRSTTTWGARISVECRLWIRLR